MAPNAEQRNDQDTRDRLTAIQLGYERWARRTFVALIVIGVTFVATAAVLYNLIEDNGRAADALCVLRSDLQVRVTSAEDFIRQHPEGIPGIPAATLKTSIVSQRQTIRALRDLNCD